MLVFEESGWSSRATLSPVPVMDSLIFVPVDFEDWGCYIMVSGCGEERMRKAAYHLLTELGVGVFAECVGHVEVWSGLLKVDCIGDR